MTNNTVNSPKEILLSNYTPPLFQIHSTHLTFDLHECYATVCNKMIVQRQGEGCLYLNGQHLTLIDIQIDGLFIQENTSPIHYKKTEDGLQVIGLDKRDHPYEVIINTRIEPQNNTALEGLYKSNNMFCTQCEAEGFRRITYYLDRPDVMSVFTTTIIADLNKYPILLSNGNKISQDIIGDNRHRISWHDPHKKPCYLFALVAGDLVVKESSFVTMSNKTVKLQIFVESQNLDKTDYAMEALKRSMVWDEQQYGREYDLDVFMIVAVDDFNMGAMENKGLNIFNSSCVLANPQTATDTAYQRIEAIVAHEYFHNWSGNRVTCRDWFQLSLKEGFTVFRDAQFSADMNSSTVKRIEDATLMRTVQYAEDGGPIAHQVQPDSMIEISNFYTVTIYEKGCEIVSMIQTLLGKKGFRAGSDHYFDAYDGQAVTINEFIQSMEVTNETDLTQFKRWYKQSGTPEVSVISEYNKNTHTYQLTFTQSCPSTPDQSSASKSSFVIPIKLGLLDKQGRALPLKLSNNEIIKNDCLVLTKKSQTYTFVDIVDEPIPSLFRDYSAPVKYHYPYSIEQLALLCAYDVDGFNRWDALSQLSLRVVFQVMDAQNKGQAVIIIDELVAVYQSLLKQNLDPAIMAKMLVLPSEQYISEQCTQVDVKAIYDARQYIRHYLGETLQEELLETYYKYNLTQSYEPNPEQMSGRALKNVALSYLVLLTKDNYTDLALNQFEHSDNMTDTMAALSSLVNSPHKILATRVLQSFYEKWKEEPLVVNQWLSVQSGSNEFLTLPVLEDLLQHESFDIKNPNKVRSVLGAFSHNATQYFHQQEGKGYKLLTDYIIQLDKINPQVSSRLIGPLTKWKRYVPVQSKLMKQQLERLNNQSDLSKDVYEIVKKALT
jgi:aminopeptidase N